MWTRRRRSRSTDGDWLEDEKRGLTVHPNFQPTQKNEEKTEFFLPALLEEEKPAPTSDAEEEESHEKPLFMVALVISEHGQLRKKRRDRARTVGCLSAIRPLGLTSQRQ